MEELSLKEARRVVLAAQMSPGTLRGAKVTARSIARLVDRLNLLQIDSVNVLSRSHYLPVFSRLGLYDRSLLDTMTLTKNKRCFFEYWGHEASFIPMHLYPLFRWRMEGAKNGENIYGSLAEFARQQRGYLESVLAQIRARGPLAARELSDSGKRIPEWWGWSKGKLAMECLFWTGELTVAARRNFERIYDLAQRVIPPDIYEAAPIARPDAVRELLRLSVSALGVGTFADLRDYFRLPLADAKRALQELEEAKLIEPVEVEGWRTPGYLAAKTPVPRKDAQCAALLSPFDPLVWERGRAERLFEFTYRIEIYTPNHKRKHGYYVLPFLLGDRFAARVCLKAHRADGILFVNTAHAESGIDQDVTVSALARELRLLATFLELPHVRVKRKGDLTAPLREALGKIA